VPEGKEGIIGGYGIGWDGWICMVWVGYWY